ncbi:MAG: T9SS type A sorting domain-containing protein, partial [Cyclonatronaceae bacterium]
PNPFNPSTNIRFTLPEAQEVRLEVYTVTGQRVATLVNERRAAGVHTVVFDGANLSSGVYVYRIIAGPHVETRKMTFIK